MGFIRPVITKKYTYDIMQKELFGAPWGTYSRRLIDSSYRIKKPIFGTYKDLEEILEITFKMYEDFKSALIGE